MIIQPISCVLIHFLQIMQNNVRNRDVHGGTAAADFLKNHRGSGAAAAGF
jgi:hypothetical protein